MLLILLSLNLVSDMVIKLGDSLTVSRISFKRHKVFGRLRVLQLNIENPFDESLLKQRASLLNTLILSYSYLYHPCQGTQSHFEISLNDRLLQKAYCYQNTRLLTLFCVF